MEIIKAFPLLFLLTVIVPFGGGIVGAYVGLESLKTRYADKKHKELTKNMINKHESSLKTIENKEALEKLGNKALIDGDRESFLKLKQIEKNFGKNREIALSEISKIRSYFYTMTSINNVDLTSYKKRTRSISDNEIETEKLISLLLLDNNYTKRAKSAQILSSRNENYVPEALLLSIFSDENIEVLRESTRAFEKLTRFKSKDFFQPYHCLGFWYDSSVTVYENLKNMNKISIIPFEQFEKRISSLADNANMVEMLNWWKTTLELELMLKKEHQIIETKGK